MQKNKKKVNKDAVISAAIKLIDENGEIKNVTLRIIAKKLGCAHTNLYNYFNSLDEIYWEALGKVLLMLMEYSYVDEGESSDFEERLFFIISNIIDFSLEHPGWYKLIWFETIGGEPSIEVKRILLQPSEGFVDIITKVTKNKLEVDKVNIICDILWSYLHGELSKLINRRSFIESKTELKAKMISNFKFLYEALIKQGGI